jgi:hypothetical protein
MIMFDTVSRYRRYADAAAEDRCARRFEVRIPARLRPSGSQGFSVLVTDLSIAGFSCEAVTAMPKGALCWLMLPGLSGLQSELIWNDGGRLGCAFDRLLSPMVLDHVVARFR